MKWWHWLIAIGGGLFIALVPFSVFSLLLFGPGDDTLVVRGLLFYGGIVGWPLLFVWICSRRGHG